MRPEAVREAVVHLQRARRDMAVLEELSPSCRPRTTEEGYDIQDAFIVSWEDDVAGWKIGATAEAPQRMLGLAEPFYGPVFSPAIYQSPAEAPAAGFHMLAVECEFAFRLGDDLPAREAGYRREEIMDAIQALVPAIEILSTRFGSLPGPGGPSIIADCGANGGLVLGKEIADWRKIDLVNQRVRLDVDGKPTAEGTGAAVLGDPLQALLWFVNRHSGRGLALRTGEIVSTGSCTGITPLKPGQSARADFASLGEVSIRFAVS